MKGHIIKIGLPVGSDGSTISEKGIITFAVIGLGLHLNEFKMIAVFYQDIDADKEVAKTNCRLINDDIFELQQFICLLLRFFIIKAGDIVPSGVIILGPLPHLETSFGKGS
ncbi:MAG: hypothetical protein K9K37_05965 [Desulfocapsa sp.]|nr:hypothetical protein [Desulfocapsa sp.]